MSDEETLATGAGAHEQVRISYTTLLDGDQGIGALFVLYRIFEIGMSDTVASLRSARSENPLAVDAYETRIRIIRPVLRGLRQLIENPIKITEMDQDETLALYLHGIYDLYTKLF